MACLFMRDSASLEVKELSCYRGESLLFEGLDWTLREGEAVQVVGPNGSGKTSLLRILAGLLPEDQGQVLWCGIEIRASRARYQRQMGYLGHHLGLKQDLTVLENLHWSLGIRGQALNAVRIDPVLETFGLLGLRDRRVRFLSQGQRQRTALARMALMDTQLWILDEPFTALDTVAIAQVEGILERHVDQGGLVVLTSHQPLSVSHLRTLRLT